MQAGEGGGVWNCSFFVLCSRINRLEGKEKTYNVGYSEDHRLLTSGVRLLLRQDKNITQSNPQLRE